jgi:hypothetical protein
MHRHRHIFHALIYELVHVLIHFILASASPTDLFSALIYFMTNLLYSKNSTCSIDNTSFPHIVHAQVYSMELSVYYTVHVLSFDPY